MSHSQRRSRRVYSPTVSNQGVGMTMMGPMKRALAVSSLMATVLLGCGGTEADGELDQVTSAVTSGGAWYERANQCNAGGQSMLCCPSGKAMVGYYPGTIGVYRSETLKCRDIV